ncbi:MAG: hypothetical protein AAGD07_05005 [Planctomycetota bacterium]
MSPTLYGSQNRVTQRGIYLELTTDRASREELADWISAFDAAVPQWLQFWGMPANAADGWLVRGLVVEDVAAFRATGDIPDAVPTFPYGYAAKGRLWVRVQDTSHYTRHLVLHEGVHALAIELFGGTGPTWYMEATAELLATHRDRVITASSDPISPANALLAQRDDFRINRIPRSKREAPLWGRFKVIDEHRNSGALPRLDSVLNLPVDLKGAVEEYTWCWVAAMMMTHYPDTRDVFLRAARNGYDRSPAFTSRLYRELQPQWPVVRARWRVALQELDYGYDWSRHGLTVSTDDSRYSGQAMSLSVAADQGWQSAGVWFPARSQVRIVAEGKCRVMTASSAVDTDIPSDGQGTSNPVDWMSGPAGVTGRFHRGNPLGQLRVWLLPIAPEDGRFLRPADIRPVVPLRSSAAGMTELETGLVVRVDQPSWLLFRVNDGCGELGTFQLADNEGFLRVEVSSVQ